MSIFILLSTTCRKDRVHERLLYHLDQNGAVARREVMELKYGIRIVSVDAVNRKPNNGLRTYCYLF